MKIGIIGDPHFGSSYNLGKTDPKTQLNYRLLDFAKTFDNIIDKFLKKDVKLVVITGDVFETRHPTSAQLNVFSKCAQRAIDKGLKIIIVVGNHDQQRTISTTTVDIFNSLNIPNIWVYNTFSVFKTKDENNNDINIILMPYRDRRMIGASTTDDAIQHLKEELSDLCKNLNGKKIVVGHFMVNKPISGENPDSFSINELVLPLSMFDNYDITVMGHVHKHMMVSQPTPFVVYVGSMEKGTFGEKHHEKVSIIIDTNNAKIIDIIKNNTRNLFEMNFNYVKDGLSFGPKITDQMINDIEEFNIQNGLAGSIVKLVSKVQEDDFCHINQDRIREYILNKNVKFLMPLQIFSNTKRTLRNKKITEDVTGKKAMMEFIKNLPEPEPIKKRLAHLANLIIEEVENK